MSDDGTTPFGPHGDKPLDVGNVSPEVLDELSRLFGGEPEQEDVTVVEAGDGHGETVTTFVEVVEIVDESLGTAPADTVTAPDDDAQVLPFRPKPADPSVPVNYGDPLIVIDEEPDLVDRSTDVDPRFEERRRAWARRDRLKRVRWLKIAGLLTGLFVFMLVVMASPLFAVRSLKFEGTCTRASRTSRRCERS